MAKIKAVAALSALTSCIAFGSAHAQVEAIQVIVPAAAALDSDSSKLLPDGIQRAKLDGAVNAWRVIRMRPDLSLKVRNLTQEQNAQLSSSLLGSCQILLLDRNFDKKLKTLSARFRFDCNQQDIQVAIDNLTRSSTVATTDRGGGRLRLAAFFLVKEVASTTDYDPTIDREHATHARQGVDNTTVTEDRFRGSGKSRVGVSARVASSEGYGDAQGRVDDSYQENLTVSGRADVATHTKEALTTSSVTDVGDVQSVKARGTTVRRATDLKYRNMSSEGLNAELSDVFRNAGIKITHYTNIFADPCVGKQAPNPDLVARSFGAVDQDLSTDVMNRLVAAIRQCGFQYLVVGDALVDGSMHDDVTGSPKYTVHVKAKILDVSDRFADVVATLQKDGSASNPTATKALSDAMFEASQRTGEEVINRLSGAGVR